MRSISLLTLLVGCTDAPAPLPPSDDLEAPGRDDALVALAHSRAAPPYDVPDAECDARYLPDDCTEAAVANQWVEVEGAVGCTGSAQPGTEALAAYLAEAFPGHGGYGIYSCRTISGSDAYSLHSEGRAIDFMIPMDSGQSYGADNSVGDPVADYLLEHAEEIGIQSFIWDRTIFYGDEEAPKHHCVSIENGHWDHLHIELTWDAAAMLTPWFNPPEEADSAESNAGASAPTIETLGDPMRVQLMTPERIFDTRQDSLSGGLVRADGSTSGPLTAEGTNTFADWAATSAPEDAEGVWLNVVGIGDVETGFLTVWPEGESRPDTSNLNLSCRQSTRSNAAPVALGDGDGVSFYSYSEVDAIADLGAAFTPSGSGLQAVAQRRLLDTRSGTPLAHEEVRAITVDCGSLGADCDGSPEGLVGMVAVLAGDSDGFLTAWPCDADLPVSSTVNFQANTVVANPIFVPLSGSGELCLYAYGNDDVDVLVDASAAILPDGPLGWQSVVPQRLLDTRSSASPHVGRLASGQSVALDVLGLPGLPADVAAVTVNLTTVSADGSGFIEAWPCDEAMPDISVLNFSGEQATAAAAVVPIGAGTGELCLYSSTRTHLLVDLLGVWVPTPDADGGVGGGLGSDTADTGADGHFSRVLMPTGGCGHSRAPVGWLGWLGLFAASLVARRRG